MWRERPRGGTVDASLRELTGIEQLRAIGVLPPLHHLTGTTFDSAVPQEAVFSMPITGWLLTPQGAVSGGVLAIPGDGALGCSIHTELPAGAMYTTAELSITYLRPVRVGTRVSARGHALQLLVRALLRHVHRVGDAGHRLERDVATVGRHGLRLRTQPH